jgi:eukaryotic-like serine/threonine-protein kinase
MVPAMSRPRLGFWSRLGFGTVPGDAEETRAFLQRRVALYLGVVSLLWLSVSITGYLSSVFFMPSLLHDLGAMRAGLIHNAAMLALATGWFFCRRGKRSRRTLGWLDAGSTIGQAIVMSTLMSGVDVRFRPDMNMAMGVTSTLIARAAIIPSNGTRTLVIGLLSVVPLLGATLLTHLGVPPETRLMPAPVVTAQVGMWLVFDVVVSATMSRVIYGLSMKVQAAARLGQYTLERKIGEGGMGVVYRARHALLRRPTAIKVLAPGRGNQHDLVRFEREVQTTSALRHPNTVAIYDYGRTPDGLFYYAMEYLDGVDLDRLIAHEGPLPEARVVHILSQIAGALAEAHAAGLIHRDIKPSNILLCDHGMLPDFAKVLDFGLVRDVSGADATTSGVQTLTGTPLYMSPEAISAPGTIDARSDLYALGAVAYALLTNTPPFTAATVWEVCAHHLHTPVEPPSERRGRPIPPALEAIVMACLAKDRAARPASAADLAERLAGCGVVPWTQAEARAWWDSRGAVLRAERAATSRSNLSDTIAIDLRSRA